LTLAVLVSGVLALAKLGFLDFITGGFDTGRFGGLPKMLGLSTYSIPVTGQTKFGFFHSKTFSGHDSRGQKRIVQMFFTYNFCYFTRTPALCSTPYNKITQPFRVKHK
jgi:hypothetical protein